jgi:hypothetical protein
MFIPVPPTAFKHDAAEQRNKVLGPHGLAVLNWKTAKSMSSFKLAGKRSKVKVPAV